MSNIFVHTLLLFDCLLSVCLVFALIFLSGVNVFCKLLHQLFAVRIAFLRLDIGTFTAPIDTSVEQEYIAPEKNLILEIIQLRDFVSFIEYMLISVRYFCDNLIYSVLVIYLD